MKKVMFYHLLVRILILTLTVRILLFQQIRFLFWKEIQVASLGSMNSFYALLEFYININCSYIIHDTHGNFYIKIPFRILQPLTDKLFSRIRRIQINKVLGMEVIFDQIICYLDSRFLQNLHKFFKSKNLKIIN